jgi:hypothetical protein
MVTAIFEAHGFTIGCHYRGTQNYDPKENCHVKQFLERNFWPRMTPCDPIQLQTGDAVALRKRCKTLFDGQRWVTKVGVDYYPLFRAAFPDMMAVVVMRPLDQVVSSFVRAAGEDAARVALMTTRLRYDHMREILANDYLSVEVLADDVVVGRLDDVATALGYFDVTLDRDLALAAVKPELWHG